MTSKIKNILTPAEAWKIVGNTSKPALRNMIKALSLHPWLNTSADDLRLAAAKVAVKTENPRYGRKSS